MQAVTRVNAEQASKRVMRKPTRSRIRGRLPFLGKRAKRAPKDSAGVLARACIQEEDRCNTGSPIVWSGRFDQTDAREGKAVRDGVTERPVVPWKAGNAGGGKGASVQDQRKTW